MTDAKKTNGLEMRWIPVTDARGRTHMECVWIDVAQVRPNATHAA